MKLFLKLRTTHYFLLLFFASLCIYLAGIYRVRSIFWGDSLYYYAYTRSIVVDQDIDFQNQAFDSQLGFPNPAEVSEITGKVTNKFSPGTAVFWIPGLIVGQALSYVANAVAGYELLAIDGSSIVSQLSVAVTALLYSIFGLWFIYKTLNIWFSTAVSTLSILSLFLNTQLFYYTAMDPVNSHSVSFFLAALLLFQFSKLLRSTVTWQQIIPMGVTAGALALVRNQDVIIGGVVLLAVFLIEKRSNLLDKLNWATLFSGSAFIVCSLQLYFTVSLFGILGSPYLIRGETLSWFNPNFFRVLFTLENGLFVFAPILLAAVIGLFGYAVRERKELRKVFLQLKQENAPEKKMLTNSKMLILVLASILIFVLQLYVVASWAPEIIGGPYGSRMFVSILPFLSIGLALYIKFLQQKLSQHSFYVLYILSTLAFFVSMIAQTFWMLYRF